mgnify:CR=1 FL=1
MPHGHCYLWSPTMVWLQVVSNGFIGLAYASISLTLYGIVRRIRDIPFSWMYLAFGVFIAACGATHFFDIATVWHPIYWADGGVRALTAVASVSTAVLLIPLAPKAVSLANAAKTARESGKALEVLLREKLSVAEEQFRTLVDNLPDLAWTAAPDGRRELCNRRWHEYTGIPAGSDDAIRVGVGVHPDQQDRVRATWASAMERGEPFELEVRLRRADGTYRWFLTRVRPLKDARGAIVRWFGSDTDIEDRKRSEEERETLIRALEGSNAELDRFAYVTSHDLKAPLRGIAQLATWIGEDLAEGDGAAVAEHLTALRRRVDRLDSLIEGILRYTRAGRADASRAEMVDVAALARETADLLALGDRVALQLPAGAAVQAERVALQQVLLNLFSNALKHAEGRAVHITVTANDEGEFLHFVISDDGPGIPAAYQERIWEIFQTLKPRDVVEGAGIGLSIVRKLVETRGGRAWVESMEGAGAHFHVLWPRRAESGPVVARRD